MTRDEHPDIEERLKIESKYCKMYDSCVRCPFSAVNNGYFVPCTLLKGKQFDDVYKRVLERRENYDSTRSCSSSN